MCLDHIYRPPRALRLLAIALVTLTGMFALGAARAAPASADIPWPYEFQPSIDGYATYDKQTGCVPAGTQRPGVIGFRNLLNFWFGVHDAQWWRACDSGDVSEHKESRALDYFVNARTDPATTLKILAWGLGTDQYGNKHAFGRRFGLMYIVSNGRIFGFYQPGDGWRPYRPSSKEPYCTPNTDPRVTACHINHIHFSFSKAGADAKTSWWTTNQRTVKGCGSTLVTWRFQSGFGPLVQIKSIHDGYGQVFDTQSEIHNSYWRVRQGGQQYFANQPLSLLSTAQAVIPVLSGGSCVVGLN
jgi:hypothetical protein